MRVITKFFKSAYDEPIIIRDKDDTFQIPSTTGYWKIIAVAGPALCGQICWWSYMISKHKLSVFFDTLGPLHTPIYFMSITMIFGSFVGGASSEGGASIAFPVLTLGFGVSPFEARDFSYMIQSVGMTCASISIYLMRLQLEFKCLLYTSLGGTLGVLFGLEYVSPTLTAAQAKMYFVTIWFAFAVCLCYNNIYHRHRVLLSIDHWDEANIHLGRYCQINWKALVLIACGFIGGVFSSIGGTGLDICAFALLTLLFDVSEKVATPTSVVLMAMNAFIAFMWRNYKMHAIVSETWSIWLCCVPVVVLGAPIGALVSSYMHRLVLVAFIGLFNVFQLIVALCIIRPWSRHDTAAPAVLSGMSAVLAVLALFFFASLRHAGNLLRAHERAQDTLHNSSNSSVSTMGSINTSPADISCSETHSNKGEGDEAVLLCNSDNF